MLLPRCVDVQRHVDNAGQQAGEIDEDPVGRVRADVGETVAAVKARCNEGVGESHRGRDDLSPRPRARVVFVAGGRIDRKAVDDRAAVEGVARPRSQEIDERRRGLADLRPRSVEPRRRRGIHRSTRSKRTAIP